MPIIVAINKIDKYDANPEKIRQALLQYEIVVEGLGGDTLDIEVSAKERTNLDKLEEAIILQAEVLELAANPDRAAEGVVIESMLDKGRGAVATVLVTRGTLRIGDIFVMGAESGRVRALIDDKGNNIKEAGPSQPVAVLGATSAPMAGDDFLVVESEARAREISAYRQRQLKERLAGPAERASLESMLEKLKTKEVQELPVVIKADVHGSAEAVASSLQAMNTDEVAVKVLLSGVGGVSESDVALAEASKAPILAFNVRAQGKARTWSTTSSPRCRACLRPRSARPSSVSPKSRKCSTPARARQRVVSSSTARPGPMCVPGCCATTSWCMTAGSARSAVSATRSRKCLPAPSAVSPSTTSTT